MHFKHASFTSLILGFLTVALVSAKSIKTAPCCTYTPVLSTNNQTKLYGATSGYEYYINLPFQPLCCASQLNSLVSETCWDVSRYSCFDSTSSQADFPAGMTGSYLVINTLQENSRCIAEVLANWMAGWGVLERVECREGVGMCLSGEGLEEGEGREELR